MSVGTNIRRLRIYKGLSQEQLAISLGYKSRDTLSKIERGVNNINFDTMELIAKEFNVSVYELMKESV